MKGQLKIIVLIIAIVAIAAFLIIYRKQTKKTSPTLPTPPAMEVGAGKEIALPKAAGNIDETANALIQASLGEELILGGGTEEADLLEIDAQAIGDFGQTINDNEF